MVVFASLSHIEHHTRGVCLFFEFHYHKNASVGLCVSYSTQYKTAVLASSVQCQHHTAIGCNQASTRRTSPRARLHVLGMLRLNRYCLDINQPILPTPFYSVRYSDLVSVSVFTTLSSVFHSIHSPDNSPLPHSGLPVLFLPYWSLQP